MTRMTEKSDYSYSIQNLQDALGEVINRKPTADFYTSEERLQQLEEEDWIGTCTTWGCNLPNK